MIFHAYEKGFYNMGRQTLLQPIEWTKDGWYKVAAGTTVNKPIARPHPMASTPGFTLNDDFEGNNCFMGFRLSYP